MAELPCIYVLAGANGAGKSSVGGAAVRSAGGEYFNPDEVAHRIRSEHGDLAPERANSLAWHEGRRLLERAIAEKKTFAFETTLGGHTITSLLEKAVEAGLEVRIWFVGLDSVERHLARVRSRVSAGGHPIPEEKIRERYDQARRNLIRLLPGLTELHVFDNSAEGDPRKGKTPAPVLWLHMRDGRVMQHGTLHDAPEWVRPILATALRGGS
ncbi:MAG: zeta toxin family protein [Candidatus Xenobia bacterium]